MDAIGSLSTVFKQTSSAAMYSTKPGQSLDDLCVAIFQLVMDCLDYQAMANAAGVSKKWQLSMSDAANRRVLTLAGFERIPIGGNAQRLQDHLKEGHLATCIAQAERLYFWGNDPSDCQTETIRNLLTGLAKDEGGSQVLLFRANLLRDLLFCERPLCNWNRGSVIGNIAKAIIDPHVTRLECRFAVYGIGQLSSPLTYADEDTVTNLAVRQNWPLNRTVFDIRNLRVIFSKYGDNVALCKLAAREIVERSQAEEVLSDFNPQDLISLGKLSRTINNTELFDLVAGELVKRSKLKKGLSELERPLELVNLMILYCRSGGRTREFLEVVAHEISLRGSQKLLSGFSSQQLSNFVLCYAELGVKQEELFHDVTREVIERNNKKNGEGLLIFRPKELKNLVNAYAQLGNRAEDLLHLVARAITRETTLTKFSLNELSDIVHSYAALGISDKDLFLAVANEVLKRHKLKGLPDLTTYHLYLFIQAYKKLDIAHPDLFAAVETELALRRDERVAGFAKELCFR